MIRPLAFALISLLGMAAVPRSAAAVLIPMDLFMVGDQALLRDTDTGLDWLRWPLANTFSIDQILGGAGGWGALGFRYATTSEVCGLVTAYGVAGSCPGGATGTAILASLVSNLGNVVPQPDGSFTSSAVFDDGNLADDKAGLVQLHYQPLTGELTRLVQTNVAFTDVPGANALVRAVPGPSVLLLLAAALSLVVTARLRSVVERLRPNESPHHRSKTS